MTTRGKQANGRYAAEMEDFIGAGFKRIDSNLIAANPPRIHWGDIYKRWPEDRKVQHLEKLAAAMNHAAALIQDERDQLNKLLEAKEQQIVSLKTALEQNNEMIQSQMLRMNEEKQLANDAYAKLNAEVRELRKNVSA